MPEPQPCLHADLKETLQGLIVFLVHYRTGLVTSLEAVDRMLATLTRDCTHTYGPGQSAIREQLFGVDMIPLKICAVCGKSWSVAN